MADEDAPTLEPVPELRQAELDSVVSSYEDTLRHNVSAVDYLRSRGLARGDVESFRLGVVGDPTPGHGRFKGMLAIPYLDRNNRPLTVRFRCIEDHNHRDFFHGKYNSITGDAGRMFNIRSIHSAEDAIHITEGEIDCIILNKLGYPAVAVPGARAFKARHRRMLAGFSRVYIWGDPDEAGSEFVTKVLQSLRQSVAVPLKFGDVNETFLEHGADGIAKVFQAAA